MLSVHILRRCTRSHTFTTAAFYCLCNIHKFVSLFYFMPHVAKLLLPPAFYYLYYLFTSSFASYVYSVMNDCVKSINVKFQIVMEFKETSSIRIRLRQGSQSDSDTVLGSVPGTEFYSRTDEKNYSLIII